MTRNTTRVPRTPGSRRGIAALAATLVAGCAGSVTAAPAAAAPAVPASQQLVTLLQDHVARTAPDDAAAQIESVDARRPLTHVRTVLPVLDSALSAAGDTWLEVRLPGRPNEHSGWIRADKTRSTATGWRIKLDLSSRRITVYRDGRSVRRFLAVIGTAKTPTPRGDFFIEEAVALSSSDAGGPFALAASARSTVLQEFAGGPGQIALHGTNRLPDALGTAASHGCVRIAPRAIRWLAGRVGAGVPFTITR
jgi:lipoprotein-anchoring transpeptidase ErfK/SrfK